MSEGQGVVPRMVSGICPRCSAPIVTINAAWLRHIRQAAGVSLREAARRFDRSAAYLSDVELGRRRATDALVGAYQAEFLKPKEAKRG